MRVGKKSIINDNDSINDYDTLEVLPVLFLEKRAGVGGNLLIVSVAHRQPLAVCHQQCALKRRNSSPERGGGTLSGRINLLHKNPQTSSQHLHCCASLLQHGDVMTHRKLHPPRRENHNLVTGSSSLY